jgi:HTH-type transcriptional regulator / antitoxin HigA
MTAGDLRRIAVAVNEVLELWAQLDRVAHPYLAPIETEAQYQAALGFLAVLWDVVNDDPDSPYGTLLRIVTDHIDAYEKERHPIPDAPPRQVLAYLIEEKGVTQKEVEGATGLYQSNLSQVLSGRRKLTAEQVKRLAAYFDVNPSALL